MAAECRKFSDALEEAVYWDTSFVIAVLFQSEVDGIIVYTYLP